MSKVDEELARRFHRAQRPLGSGELLEGIASRRRRRESIRRVEVGLLALAVLLATGWGFFALRSAFDVDERNVGSTPSATNGDIVFSLVGSEGRLQLFVAHADGSHMRALTTPGSFDDLNPAVSPDGRTVAFERRLDGAGFVIATIPITGGAVQELTDRAVTLEPAWSPDGSRIAFVGSLAGDRFGLWVMHANGSSLHRIAGSDSFDVISPTWSPDGSRIAFVGFHDGDDTKTDIYSITTDRADLIRVTDTPAIREVSPAWSPDGRSIAFAQSGDDIEGSEIWTVHPDGGAPSLIERTDFPMLDQVTWSPDGTSLLATFNGWVQLVDLRTGGFVRLVEGTTAAWQPVTSGPELTAGPQPTSSPTPEGLDIGLGVRMCNLEVLEGIDWDGTGIDGAAWTGVPVDEDGRCSPGIGGPYVVAVDRDGDGVAEQTATSTFGSCLLCRPYAAADLSGDGVLELVVLEEASSTPTYSIYEVSVGERSPGVYPIFVAPPGNPAMNLDAGDRLRVMVGGDEGFSGGIRCEGDGPRIEYTWTNGAVDRQTDLDVDVTTFVITAEGATIRSIDAFSIPRDTIPDPVSSDPACGVDWWQLEN